MKNKVFLVLINIIGPNAMHLIVVPSLLVARKSRETKKKRKENIPENMSMGKTYFIRKVGGGGGQVGL